MEEDALYDDDVERMTHLAAAHSLAEDFGVPEEEVVRIYEKELRKLKIEARVKEFLPVLATRGVWRILKGRLPQVSIA